MNNMKINTPLLSLLLVALLAGCVTPRTNDSYSRDQTRREMTVRMGVVESVREVTMEGSKSGIGSAAGAVVGGVAGSGVGQGKGQIVGAVLGAVAGGLAGNAIEGGTTTKPALEITVKLDSGQMIAIVQEGSPNEFRAGDRVRILGDRGESRVTR